MAKVKTYCLDILNILINANEPVTTTELEERVGCNRKTVYNVMNQLECAGFSIVIGKTENGQNTYILRVRNRDR